MKLYAETASMRARQLAGDLAVVAWVSIWVLAGVTLRRLVEQLAAPGRSLERAGESFTGDIADIQEKVGRVPVVGDELQDPFGRLGGVGETLADAGVTQQQVVHDLALWLGVLVAAVPIVALLVVWLPRRVSWGREAGAASRLRRGGAGLELFALRAVANRPLRQLRRVSSDPAGALRAGDYLGLASLELGALGLRPDPRGEPPER
jgi:FAD/FMN-containing dehydrogenase